jgi:hypothetical protein
MPAVELQRPLVERPSEQELPLLMRRNAAPE